MKNKLSARHVHGWHDPKGIFGDVIIRREGEPVIYDSELDLGMDKHEVEVELDTGEIVNDNDDA